MGTELPPDWDPAPAQRKYKRSVQTGDLGYIVRRSGAEMIRIDNPRQEVLKKYIPAEWVDEEIQRTLMPLHVARIAFEADREVCRAYGLHVHARRDWSKLELGEQQLYLRDGPKGPKNHPAEQARRAVFAQIKVAMEPFLRVKS